MSASPTESDLDGRGGEAEAAVVAMESGVDEDMAELAAPEMAGGGDGALDATQALDDVDVADVGAVTEEEGTGADATSVDTAPNNDDNDDARTIRAENEQNTAAEEESLEGEAAGAGEGGPVSVPGPDADKSPLDSPVPPPAAAAAGAVSGNGSALGHRYRALVEANHNDHLQDGSASEDGSSVLGLPHRPGSPAESLVSSVPDSTASAQRSVVSSVASSASRFGLRSASPSFRPFDQRFQSRIASPRSASPALHALGNSFSHSRSVSISSQFRQLEFPASGGGTDTSSPPWEVVRWTKLIKLSSQAFSESAKRNFGSPTCMAISTSIVLGTTKGILLLFDYNQNLKMIIGPGTRAVEAGAVTAVAISADHTTVAGGHADGSIFTWETTRASRPFLHIPPLDATQAQSPNRSVDGHLLNFAITNLGFLGTRRTALVSADDRGMAFAHLATRGTGSLGRTVRTNRILGRYPGSKPPVSGKPIKPSTVLAFAPLPLGNVDRATDTMGLTAMLTPYLLVIVSTTPVANTQHKSPRPKDVEPHSAMSGCLAWFPAVKLKLPDPRTGDTISKAKLVYCWSNVLTVLDVAEVPSEDKDKPPSLHCKARSRWKCEEAIVAVQWLTRSVLAVLTISQRLIVLEDHTMRVTEAFDLINRFIYHVDLFSRQLHAVVETLNEDDTSMHGVVADAFYMSFKAYKGRLFLLGFNDMAIGALSNWADRLIALMEHGDYVGAIQLATSFYTGDAEKLTIGLPEDTNTRHTMVQERLMEIMTASLKFAFTRRQKNRAAADDGHLEELAQTCFVACESVGDTDFLFDDMYEWFEDAGAHGIFLETLEPYILDQTITAVPPTVVKAMVAHYVGRGLESRLEEMICHMNTMTLDLDQITSLCKQHGLYDALIYVWNQAMSDFITPLIDLLSLLVPHMPNGEYEAPQDATVEQDMHDTNALKMFPYLSYVLTGRIYPSGDSMDEQTQQQAKCEIYWFLFSGQAVTWPRGSNKQFLTRPEHSQEPSFPYLRMILKFHAPSFLAALNEAFEDSFLNDSPEKQLLNGSGPRQLPEEQVFGLTVNRQYIVSILTEIMNPTDFAPEDTIYLDMFIARNLPKYPQYLLIPESTLTKVLAGLCRYPGSDLEEDAQLSAEYLLSVYHPPDMPDLIPLFKEAGFYRILKQTYRTDKQYGKLLKTYFEDPDDRSEVFSCIAECLRPQVDVPRRQIQDVHTVIKEHAREIVELDPAEAGRKLDEFAPELHQHILESVEDRRDLQYVYLKTILEPETSGSEAPGAAREDGEHHHRHGRRSKLHHDKETAPARDRRDLIEQYVRLMCEFDPTHVSDYVGLVQSTDLRLDELLPAMEETGVIDAAVVLMAREGQIQDAMDRLVQHLHTLESAVQGLLVPTNGDAKNSSKVASRDGTDSDAKSDSGDSSATVIQHNAAEDLMRALQKYTHVGIWLCQGHTKTLRKSGTLHKKGHVSKKKASDAATGKDEEHLSPDERLWLDLIDVTVKITRNLSSHIQEYEEAENEKEEPKEDAETGEPGSLVNGRAKAGQQPPMPKTEADRLVGLLRSLVQHTFTALLTTTTSSVSSSPTAASAPTSSLSRAAVASAASTNLSFLRILKAFLARAAVSSPSLADLRSVLASIFAAYAYEESILRLSNRLLERSLFVSVKKAVVLRQRGWRAKGSTCEACGRRVWGPGVHQTQAQGSTTIYAAWQDKQAADARRRAEHKKELLAKSRGTAPDRGKGKENAEPAREGHHLRPEDGYAGKGKGKQTAAAAAESTLAIRSRSRSPLPGHCEPGAEAGAEGTAVAGTGQRGTQTPDQAPGQGVAKQAPAVLGPLVLFACRHIYHQTCLDALEAQRGSKPAPPPGHVREREYTCPIDG